MVAQELVAKGYELFYYAKGSRAEVDFVVDGPFGTMPIEVKSGRAFTRHAALDDLLATPDFHMQEGIVFSRSNVRVDGKVTYLPLYMTMCLEPPGGLLEEGFRLETTVI